MSNWRIAGLLLAGSIPASLATIALMHFTGLTKGWASALTFSLGIALLLTAVVVAYGRPGMPWACGWSAGCPNRASRHSTVLCGLILGVLVSLSSIGAGAIGATLILLLYPRLESHRVVGTDIAHAVPLTLRGRHRPRHAGPCRLGAAGCAADRLGARHLAGRATHRKMPERLVRALLCVALRHRRTPEGHPR